MSSHKNLYQMAALPEDVVGPTVVEEVNLGNFELKLLKPLSPDRLLDLGEVETAYKQDEYLPYWATLWPVAKYLAADILAQPWQSGGKAIELGCGLGLPGLTAGLMGFEVTFTDYDATALKFAEENARLNGLKNFQTVLLDWRTPLPKLFDLILASDLIYERRNVQPLVDSFKAMLAPGGVVLLADQNRAYQNELQNALRAAGFDFELRQIEPTDASNSNVSGSIYRITRDGRRPL